METLFIIVHSISTRHIVWLGFLGTDVHPVPLNRILSLLIAALSIIRVNF